MTRKGTQITYQSAGRNPDGDNRINLKGVPKIKSKKEIKKLSQDEDFFFIHVSDFETYGIDKLTHRHKTFFLLEPNPVTFYFSIAFDVVPQFEKAKNELSNLLRCKEQNETHLAIIFSLIFRVASIGILFSFLSIEAFMNQELPDYLKIDFRNKKMTKEDIQRWATFDEKLLSIIPEITKKDFNKRCPKQSSTLRKYKTLRDELVHLKQKKKAFASYNNIYQDILNINLSELVSIAKSYMNFYRPGTIINFEIPDNKL